MRFSSVFLATASIFFVVAPALGAPVEEGGLSKRQTHTDARFTYYEVGLGACGQRNTDSQHVVALNAAEFGSGYPGPHCFDTITISYGGRTTTATIVDRCPGCPYGGLDLSPSLFEYFAPLSTGVIYGTWSYN